MDKQLNSLINHLQHIGLPVSDIKASEAFYIRFGFENVMESSFVFEGETGICIMMKLKEMIIELYQMPEKQLLEIRQRRDGHIDHIAFDVDNIDSAFSLLKERSFNIVEEKPVYLSTFWNNGCKYFNIIGPDGERLEFNQIVKVNFME